MTGWGIGEISLAIGIDTDTVNGLVESNVTAGTVTNGTVAFDNTAGKYTLGDEVTVTLTPNADEANKKYVLESVKLNDEDIDLSQIENGVYKFTVEKSAYTIAVVYKAVLVANIDVTVTATKFGETQSLREVVLSNANYNCIAPPERVEPKLYFLTVSQYPKWFSRISIITDILNSAL